ncbi:MAG: hypothetical protein AAGI09_11240 [Pseudomonadota bacterium]
MPKAFFAARSFARKPARATTAAAGTHAREPELLVQGFHAATAIKNLINIAQATALPTANPLLEHRHDLRPRLSTL